MKDALMTVNGTAIQAYGEREQIREIIDRLMSLHPAAKDVGEHGMRAVAQLAVMAGANPLPGANEIYVWDQKGRPQIDLGIAYYRRKASEKDTVMWIDGNEPRPMTEAERSRYQVPDGAKAGICKGFVLSKYLVLLDRGVPWDAAQKMLGRTSTAVVSKSEMFRDKDSKYKDKVTGDPYYKAGDPISPPTGRTWQWVAEKRAEKGFYRMLSLVDTTLTDAMQEQTQKALRQLRGERPPVDNNVFEGMTLDEMNNQFFDTPMPVEAEFDEINETAVNDAAHVALDGKIVDIRATLEEKDRLELGDVCEAAKLTGLYNSKRHAINALKSYDFPEGFKRQYTQRVTIDGACKLFNWLVERKLKSEEE